MTASVSPKEITAAPYTYTISGTVVPPLICPKGTNNPRYCKLAPCPGKVNITVLLPDATYVVLTTEVRRDCTFTKGHTVDKSHLVLERGQRRHTFTIEFNVRYLGNSVLSEMSPPALFAKAVVTRPGGNH